MTRVLQFCFSSVEALGHSDPKGIEKSLKKRGSSIQGIDIVCDGLAKCTHRQWNALPACVSEGCRYWEDLFETYRWSQGPGHNPG